ncbi:MAG: prolipoprotein diacylglyceryl transferase [Fluviicola sp.]
MVLGIDWSVRSEIFEGWRTPNLYGLLFISGMIIGYYIVRKMFKVENIHEKYLDKLLLFVVPATIIGARLGHVFFYDWDEYKNRPMDIFKVWEGGLASHGAAIMILIMLYFYSRNVSKRPMLWILDRVVVAIALAGCFIRLGNLVNHEIVGTPTDLPWGFKFLYTEEKYQGVYRHPAQLYEAICYLISFIFLYRMYWKTKAKYTAGKIFGAFMVLIWTVRFVIEFVKEGQSKFDGTILLNTGQLLSIPFILIGIYLLVRKVKPEEQERYKEIVDTPLN